MTDTAAEKTYGEAEVTARLSGELAHWVFRDGAIHRRYRTGGWKATLMVVNAVGHLAEAAWHHPEIEASYGSVLVRLTTHSAKGVTDKDLALARKIEGFVLWRPSAGEGPLDGTPDDPRYRYLQYD